MKKEKPEEKFIPVERAFKKLWKRKSFRAAYHALDDEFLLVKAIMDARIKSRLSQSAIAKKMGTSQSAIARMESGHLPSMATLLKYAAATGTKLRVSFVKV